MNAKIVVGGIGLLMIALVAAYYVLMPFGRDVVNGSQKEVVAKSTGKRVLYIDSYHEGYAWSDGITEGIKKVLDGAGVELKVHRMDTKRNTSEEFKVEAGERAKRAIEEFKPDVVIVSDDNAVKYVLEKYFKNASLPFVYCGLNWDSSLYGLPYTNTTGMVEVALTNQLIDKLAQYAKGQRMGYLSADTETEQKNLENYRTLLNLSFEKVAFVKNFEDWKASFKDMHNSVDILIFENNAGIADWNDEAAKAFALEHSKVPSGTLNDWVMETVLIGLTKVPAEQGEFSGEAALKILGGTSPTSMKEVTNKKGDLMLNLQLAKKFDIAFAPAMLRAATRILK